MLRKVAPTSENGLTVDRQILEKLGEAANQAAANNAFSDYRERKAANTIRRQDADLALFEKYLSVLLARAEIDLVITDLSTNPESWHGIIVSLGG